VSKPTHISRYYADDKDIFDLLAQGTVSLSKLRVFLRLRGIILSPALPKEEICRYFQTSPLSWPQLETLLEIIETPDREDKFSTCQIPAADLDIQKVVAAAAAVQQERGARQGEVYRPNVSQDGALELAVDYTEPNFSKTRCLQQANKTLVIRVEREGDHFMVRHHENARAVEILDAIEKKLVPAAESPPPRREIVVSGLTSVQRSSFFVEMARGIAGYELKDERGLQVDRPLDSEAVEDGDESEEEGAQVDGAVPGPSKAEIKEAKEQFQGLVKRALLHGTSLLMSQQYQDYAKSGFCLSKLIWTVDPESGDGPLIEFGAEFRDGERGTGFRYEVFGKYERHDDGSFAKSRRGVESAEKHQLLALLEASAYAALSKAQEAEPSS
jgi:hypothetical protein